MIARSLLLRAMAERSVWAFDREHRFPHMTVFADRNRVEKEETFELASAARDRFMLELRMPTPSDAAIRRQVAQDFANCALPIDDRIARARANPLEQIVEIRIVERPRQYRDAVVEPQSVRDGVNLPVAEVAGEEQHAAPVLMRLTHTLFVC